jgi:hypothetical protein
LYDLINDPPGIGAEQLPNGLLTPIFFLKRQNGQFVFEGLAASGIFTLGGVGLILMDKVLFLPEFSFYHYVILLALSNFPLPLPLRCFIYSPHYSWSLFLLLFSFTPESSQSESIASVFGDRVVCFCGGHGPRLHEHQNAWLLAIGTEKGTELNRKSIFVFHSCVYCYKFVVVVW